jgi:hypothetical protein
MSRLALRLLVAAAITSGLPAAATAQAGDAPAGQERPAAVAGGGEISAVLGPADALAFFNYTDYHRNALRVGRIRLFGEWEPVPDRLSVIAEVRSENATDIEAPALYLRWRPIAGREVFIQAGRVPPVFGAFGRRAYGRDNAVLGLPLAYQYLTSLRPDALPATTDDLLRMRGRGWQPIFPLGSRELNPGISLVSVSRWDTGVEASWTGARLEAAASLTQGSPAVPVVRDHNGGLMVSGRAAAHLPAGVTIGVSASQGQWLNNAVLALTPAGTSSNSRERVVGIDFELGSGPWLVRSEWMRGSFEIPLAGMPDPDARLGLWSGFVEARYQLRPRWQIGTRVDHLDFSTIVGTLNGGRPTPWDAPVSRVEATLAFRLSRRTEIRAGWQENWRSAGRVHTQGFPAVAALCWF